MRKTIMLTVFILTGMIITSCMNNQTVIQRFLFEKSWTHSSEESVDGEFDIYRPSNYKEFPPRRFRQVFIFKDNKLCDYLTLSPNDAHFMKNGSWDYDEKTNIMSIYNENSEKLYEFKVMELNDTLLKLKVNNQ